MQVCNKKEWTAMVPHLFGALSFHFHEFHWKWRVTKWHQEICRFGTHNLLVCFAFISSIVAAFEGAELERKWSQLCRVSWQTMATNASHYHHSILFKTFRFLIRLPLPFPRTLTHLAHVHRWVAIKKYNNNPWPLLLPIYLLFFICFLPKFPVRIYIKKKPSL